MKTVIKQLEDFLTKSANNFYHHNRAWLQDDKMEVYVRAGHHYIRDKDVSSLDIANVNVFEPGKGVFTHFLQEAEKLNIYDVLFIENVLTPRFASWFEKQGYEKRYIDGFVPCYYKFNKVEHYDSSVL